jgi:hypothetical protein
VEALVAPVRNLPELETVIAAQAREPNGGLVVMPDGFTRAPADHAFFLDARRDEWIDKGAIITGE